MASAKLNLPANGPLWLPAFAASIVTYLNLLTGRLTIDLAVKSVTTTYTATSSDATILADATAGAFTVTLPKVALVPGRVLTIKRMNSGANAVTVDGDGSETIDGSANASLSSQYASVKVQSTGTAWVKI